jgi:hypothetical protein
MTTDQPERIWSGIDGAKVIAGTLAAVSAAVCASFLGVTGTLVGAGVASLVGTVGQEIYAQSLKRGYRRLRPTKISASAATPGTVTPHESTATPASSSALRTSAARASAAGVHPIPRPESTSDSGAGTGGGIRWKRVALAAAGAFLLAMIAIAAVELVSGRALAGMLGDESAGRSTIGSVVDGPRTPEVTVVPTPEPSSTGDAPATTQPTTQPTDQPTGPTQDPATAPTTDAPAPTAEVTQPAQRDEPAPPAPEEAPAP